MNNGIRLMTIKSNNNLHDCHNEWIVDIKN